MSDYKKYFNEPTVKKKTVGNEIRYAVSISRKGESEIFLHREIRTEEKEHPKQLIEDAKQSLIIVGMKKILQEA